MSRHNLHRASLRFHRTASAAFKDAAYGAAIERPMPRSILASPSFYIAGGVSILLWFLIGAFL